MSSTNAGGGSDVKRLVQTRTAFLNLQESSRVSRIKYKDLIAPAHNNDCSDSDEMND